VLIKSGEDLLVEVDRTLPVAVVTVSGELDADTAPRLDEHLDRFDAGGGVVVLDLTGVGFCDSVGLAGVLSAARRGVDLRVACSRRVARVVALTGMDGEFRVFGSVADAAGRSAVPALAG
jgi:anti-sigma B factor antagonist